MQLTRPSQIVHNTIDGLIYCQVHFLLDLEVYGRFGGRERLMAKFSGQSGRLGLGIFWPILNFIWPFWGSAVVPLAS